MNNAQYNGQMHPLHQQQLEQLQQQQHLHEQHLTPHQIAEMTMQQQEHQQNRRKIRKQKNNAGNPPNGPDGNRGPPNAPGKKERKTIDDNVSIEEALKALTMTAEGACSAIKTPVSVLQELLSRRGITPTYDLVQIEGAIHEPTFRYRVTFGSKDGEFGAYSTCDDGFRIILCSSPMFQCLEAMGAGRSKKEAKHQAARNLIDKLTGVQIADQILPPPVAANGDGE